MGIPHICSSRSAHLYKQKFLEEQAGFCFQEGTASSAEVSNEIDIEEFHEVLPGYNSENFLSQPCCRRSRGCYWASIPHLPRSCHSPPTSHLLWDRIKVFSIVTDGIAWWVVGPGRNNVGGTMEANSPTAPVQLLVKTGQQGCNLATVALV